MTKVSPTSHDQRPTVSQLASVCLPLLMLAAYLVARYENEAYSQSVLRFYSWQLSSLDRGLVFGAIFSKSCVLMSIPIGMGMWLSRRWGTSAFWLLAVLAPLAILAYIATDMRIKVITGQSLEYYLRRAIGQDALRYGGDGKRYLLALVLPLIASAVGLAIALAFRRRIERGVARVPTRISRWVTGGTIGLAITVIATVLTVRSFANQPAALMRLHQQFPSQAVFFTPTSVEPTGVRAFGVDTRSQFSELGKSIIRSSRTGQVFDGEVLPGTASYPDVVILILESFRFDSIRQQSMPKLHARAQNGFIATNHLSGSNCSPQGSFALLFGQYATHYDAVLDRGHRPVLCERWKASGYRTYLAASCVFDYRRMDEMFSKNAFDDVATFTGPHEQWPESDRKTLSAIADRIGSNAPVQQNPTLAVGYLMSTHYDYQCPAEYNGFKLDESITQGSSQSVKEQRSVPESISRGVLLERYQRSLRFMDDELNAFLKTVDFTKTIVVITGDHGESIYDDGVLSHGSRLSAIQTRTPLLILGTGVPQMVRESISSHVDVIPTLWELCGGIPVNVVSLHGESLLQIRSSGSASTGLLVHEYPDSWDLMAIRGTDRLLLNQSRTKPRLSVLGFSDEDGLVAPHIHRPPSEVPDWVDEFTPLTVIH